MCDQARVGFRAETGKDGQTGVAVSQERTEVSSDG